MRKERILLGIMLVVLVCIVGCTSKKSAISNNYIEIKQYDGLEIDKVEEEKVTDEDVSSYIEARLKMLADGGTVPELNEETVLKLSDTAKSVDDYKAEVRKSLEASNQKAANQTLSSEVWDAIMENTKVKKLPEDEIDALIQENREYYEKHAESEGISYADYLAKYGLSEDSFDDQIKEGAKETVKKKLVTKLIMEKEGLTLSDKEYEKGYEECAKKYGYQDVDALREDLSEERLKEMVNQETVENWLIDHAKQV